ncbi:hypothetical protein [Kitasatospora sp. NPDC057936]|uniref:hypothetical protein n=1 Tax=Kitasatospora sp. NPDC057936 TaxID=3346283 RepID=UPI0036DE1837
MTLPWHTSLTASVHALGAAAHEARLAARAARTALDMYDDVDRFRLVDGHVTRPGAVHVTATVRPQANALLRITDIHRITAAMFQALYETTARAYADGAVWAIGQVLDGRQPVAVHGSRTDDGQFAVTEPLPFIDAGLNRWPGRAGFDAARAAMCLCLMAQHTAEEIAAADEVTEREAAEMFDAGRQAEGLADAAYTFGHHAEQALRHVLTGARHAS